MHKRGLKYSVEQLGVESPGRGACERGIAEKKVNCTITVHLATQSLARVKLINHYEDRVMGIKKLGSINCSGIKVDADLISLMILEDIKDAIFMGCDESSRIIGEFTLPNGSIAQVKLSLIVDEEETFNSEYEAVKYEI